MSERRRTASSSNEWRPGTGTATTRGDALVYETADAAKSITREHILIRNGLKEKVVKGPTPAAEAPAPPTPKPAASTETPKTEAPKVESAKDEAPAAKEEHKPEHKPEPKAEQKPEHKGDTKPEHHKGEHKAKAPKAEKDAAPAKDA